MGPPRRGGPGDLPPTSGEATCRSLVGDLHGLGPVRLLTGTHDILNPDARLLARRARETGVQFGGVPVLRAYAAGRHLTEVLDPSDVVVDNCIGAYLAQWSPERPEGESPGSRSWTEEPHWVC